MARNTSISLSDHFCGFIEAQVETGRFGSASEVVREALRLLEAREVQLEGLRRAVQEGEASGDPVPFEMQNWLDEQDRLDSAA